MEIVTILGLIGVLLSIFLIAVVSKEEFVDGIGMPISSIVGISVLIISSFTAIIGVISIINS